MATVFPLPPYDPLVTYNAMEQQKHARDVDAYHVQCELWISSNKQLRDMGRPLTPKPVKPQLTVWVRDAGGNITTNIIDDPNLKDPELPPAPPTISSPPPTTSPTTADQGIPFIMELLAHVIDQNNQILKALAK